MKVLDLRRLWRGVAAMAVFCSVLGPIAVAQQAPSGAGSTTIHTAPSGTGGRGIKGIKGVAARHPKAARHVAKRVRHRRPPGH
jgi:hypothetical protein